MVSINKSFETLLNILPICPVSVHVALRLILKPNLPISASPMIDAVINHHSAFTSASPEFVTRVNRVHFTMPKLSRTIRKC